MAGILKVDELHNALGNNCASLTNTGIAVRVANYAGEGTYPTLTAAESGYMIYDSVLKTMVFWDGSEWFSLRKQGNQDGSTPTNAIENFAEWYSNGGTAGEYWIKPSGYGGAAEQVAIDVDGSATFSGINDSGVWIRIRYSQSYYSRNDAWRGQSGLSNPANQSSTAYSGDFAFDQSDGLIQALLDQASETRQIFESWGAGSVGWTYGSGYMESRGFDNVNYTRWNGSQNIVGKSYTRTAGMSHSVTSINGPWDNPTARNTDDTDRNDSATWRVGRFYFRYTGGSGTAPLPIRGIWNADVDGSNERRYFPFRDAAGGWSGQGESDIFIKVL